MVTVQSSMSFRMDNFISNCGTCAHVYLLCLAENFKASKEFKILSWQFFI